MAKSKVDQLLALHQPSALRDAGGIKPWSKKLAAAPGRVPALDRRRRRAGSVRVRVGRKTRLRSPSVDEPLYELLEVPSDQSPLGWLGRPDQPLAVLTCFCTVIDGPVFCDLAARGQARWSRHNKRNRNVDAMSGGWVPFAPATMRTQPAPSPFWGNEAFDGGGSKLGDDGVYYVFVCVDDALAATTQQQM